jgi:hypothetical protein
MHFLALPFDQTPSLTGGIAPIYLALIGFVCFWFISKSERIKTYYFKKYTHDTAWLRFNIYGVVITPEGNQIALDVNQRTGGC